MSTVDTVVVRSAEARTPVEMSRHAVFAGLLIGVLLWLWTPLAAVIRLSLEYGRYEHYSHILAVPFMSAFVLYLDRRLIFSKVEGRPRLGVLIMMGGFAASWLPALVKMHRETAWSLSVLAAVAMCAGAFILCYGLSAFRKAVFPLLFLSLMAPFPPGLLQAVVQFLQWTSAEATAVIFGIIGVPVFREGFLFALPGLNIEIAEECSGIRSTLALFILSLVCGHLFLRSGWTRMTLALVVVPLAIIKNAVRIVVLSMLAIHVDPSFITGSAVHRSSGIPVFAISFAILGGIIWLLQKSETRLGRQ